MDVDQALDTQRALNLDSLKSTHPIHSTVETPAEIDESFDSDRACKARPSCA